MRSIDMISLGNSYRVNRDNIPRLRLGYYLFIDNNCFKKQKYKFVSLSSVKINEKVTISPVLETAVTQIVRASTTTTVSTTSKNTKQLMPTVSVNDSNIRKRFIRTIV